MQRNARDRAGQQQVIEHQLELAQIKQEVESKRAEFQRSENSCAYRARSNKRD